MENPTALADDLLEEVFIRTASPADLARASAACVSFCRLITNPSFTRRHRSLHPPPLLGFVGSWGLHPVDPPHPNASAARAVAVARTIDFSFAPSAIFQAIHEGGIIDVRDGRVLVDLIGEKNTRVFRRDLAVCHPVFRRWQLVPRIPDDLLDSAQIRKQSFIHSLTFLVPSEDALDASSFSLMRCIHVMTGLVLFVFSSRSGCWSVAASTTWDSLDLESPLLESESRCYVYGCFYWKVFRKDKLLKLDMATMMFSTHDLPPHHGERAVSVVEAGDGNLAIFSQVLDGPSLDYYIFLQDGSEKGGEWLLNNAVQLPSEYRCHMAGLRSEGHIFLLGIAENACHHACFTLETATFKVVQCLNGISALDCPYFGFPPIIPPRRIQGFQMD